MDTLLRKYKLYHFGVLIAVAASYLLTARLGLEVALNPGFATAFWPPSGIAVASILLFGNWVWPGILIGSFIANALTSAGAITTTIFVSFGIGLASSLQALAAAYFINKYADGLDFFQNHKSVFKFIMYSLLACTIASTTGTVLLLLTGIITPDQVSHTWFTWLIGDAAGIFIFMPCIIAWVKTFDFEEVRSQFLELVQICIYVVLVSLFCFWNWFGSTYPIEYMYIPFLMWALFRFQPWVATSLLLIISCIATWGTANHLGPFHQENVNISLLLLQAFLAVYAIGCLSMVSVLNELDSAFIKVEEYNMLLKSQIDNSNTTTLLTKNMNPIEKLLDQTPNHKIREKIDFNGLVTGFTNLVYLNRQQQDKNAWGLNLEKVLDATVGEVELIPVDFSKAFAILLNQAFEAVRSIENPEISVQTHNLGDKVSVVIRDNGKARTSGTNETEYLKCYELIVKKQGGEIKHSHVDDGFEEYALIMPK